MKTYLRIVALSLLPAMVAFAQPPANPNGANNNFQPGAPGAQPGNPAGQPGQPGQQGGGGRRGFFFGPPPNAMFTAIDVDGDGVITKAELRRAVAQLKKLDADQDGNITLAEVSPAGGPGGQGRFGDPTQFVNGMMQNDRNGDGMLAGDELPPPMQQMVQMADQNGDGALDRAELTAHMENMRNRFRGGPGGFAGGGPGGFRGPGGFEGQPVDANQMTGRLMQNDRNGDGILSQDELPQDARRMLRGADQNNDNAIDAAELQAYMRRMGDRARALGPNGDDDRSQRRGESRRGRQRGRDENEPQ
jgi:Ca2+-binding EF-hand superfamily protein